jgi:sugar lactone lactonase YvrE
MRISTSSSSWKTSLLAIVAIYSLLAVACGTGGDRPAHRNLAFLGQSESQATVDFPGSSNGARVSVVASGFDNPRGVAFYHRGLLVAEAGHAGPACTPDGTCVGLTSQISSVDLANGSHRPLVSNLFSVFDPEAGGVLGVSGLSVNDGRLLAIISAAPQWFDGFPCTTAECRGIINTANMQAGRLISVSRNGKWHPLASVGAFDFAYTTAHPFPPDEPDANPYGVLAVDEGAYVADSASNTLDFIDKKGTISVVHHFFKYTPADYPVDAVPTCVARTDDTLWVADLSGRLFRMNGGTATQVPLSLIHHVTGCAGDEDGNLYLVDMWGTRGRPTPFTGSVVRYRVEKGTASVVADRLNFPNMIAIGPDHNIYVSANSVCPANAKSGVCAGGGTVLRIRVPEEDSP